MRRFIARDLLLVGVVAVAASCRVAKRAPVEDAVLSGRIERLVDVFLASDDEATEQASLADARAIFEREGVPGMARVGDRAAYRFVFINMSGQEPDFQKRFAASVKSAAERHELPADAVVFAEARTRDSDVETRYSTRTPSHPALRDRIEALFKDDQSVRQKEGFDLKKMEETDRRMARPLQAILEEYGVPTFDMVGMQPAKDFVIMIQHQPAAFRTAVLPKLKSNVDVGQAEGSAYAMVYDRSQRDQGKDQLYGEQLECANGTSLKLAPIDNPGGVDMRRAQLGLMRLDIYERLVRESSPDVCGAEVPKR